MYDCIENGLSFIDNISQCAFFITQNFVTLTYIIIFVPIVLVLDP